MSVDSLTCPVEDPEDDGQRADVVLGRRLPGLSRRVARRMALDGHVRLDGARIPPSTRVRLGQRLEVRWTQPETSSEDPRVEILKVTDDYVFALKPAGLHTHRLRPDQPPALADMVAEAHPECARASTDPREGGAVHRLDLETSGVVLFARNRQAWSRARQAFASGAVRKRYIALCHAPESWPPDPEDNLPGWIEPADPPWELKIRAPVGRGARRSRAAVSLRGQPALTRLRRCDRSADGSLILCELDLQTGRRHQARVHLSWLGAPIVGDPRYGPGDDLDQPLMLHASALDLGPAGPSAQAPLPPAFAELLRSHNLQAPPVPDRDAP